MPSQESEEVRITILITNTVHAGSHEYVVGFMSLCVQG